jgi:hypothetical protein
MNKQAKIKAPAFQFYPSDWLTDPSLRLCSLQTRGAWIDILCVMFLSDEPGYLKVQGHPISKENLQKMLGLSKKNFEFVFDELRRYNVMKIDDFGTYFSKRMVEDERVRNLRREVGSLGGNPNLKRLVKNLDNQTSNQNPTPSSSSSYISSTIIEDNKKNIQKKDDHVLQGYVNQNCPQVSKLKVQLTGEQCEKLLGQYSQLSVEETLLQMENHKNLTSKYTSVYLTLNNWLKRKINESASKTVINRAANFEDALRNF